MSWNNTSSSFIDVTRKWFFFSSEFKFVVLDWWSSIEYGAIKGPVRNWLSIESNDYRIHQCCDPLTPSGPTDLEHHVGGTPLASFFFFFAAPTPVRDGHQSLCFPDGRPQWGRRRPFFSSSWRHLSSFFRVPATTHTHTHTNTNIWPIESINKSFPAAFTKMSSSWARFPSVPSVFLGVSEIFLGFPQVLHDFTGSCHWTWGLTKFSWFFFNHFYLEGKEYEIDRTLYNKVIVVYKYLVKKARNA